MADNRFTPFGRFRIYHNQEYYLCYSGGRRELSSKEEKEWQKTKSMPNMKMIIKEQQRLGLRKNPNVIPMKGSELLSFMKELNFIPFFDPNFNNSHLCQLADQITYESIKAKSYEIAMSRYRKLN